MTVEMAQLKKACKQYMGSKYLLQVQTEFTNQKGD